MFPRIGLFGQRPPAPHPKEAQPLVRFWRGTAGLLAWVCS